MVFVVVLLLAVVAVLAFLKVLVAVAILRLFVETLLECATEILGVPGRGGEE